MTTQRQRLGTYGEHVAAQHLVRGGMVVLDRNWRGAGGEIDLVLRDGRTLVICEVKTRSSTAFGSPLEGVSATKAARLRRLAAQWMTAHDVRAPEVRIDLVGVLRTSEGVEVDHVAGVC
jgi:putative endonuclease